MTNPNVRPELTSEAEMRMREIYAQELGRDGEEVAALLWRESGPAHPDSANGRIIRAMLAAEAAAIEKCIALADECERQQDCDHGAANTGGAAAVATAIRSLKEGPAT